MIEVKLTSVTPTLAAEWLQKNFSDNRNLRSRIVEQYAEDMTAGRWSQNAETIKFDTLGNLVDGQHRLQAVVKSGKTVDFWVASGLPQASIANIDIGAKRAAGDALRVAGISSYHTAQASLAKRILAWQSGSSAIVGVLSGAAKAATHTQIVEYVSKNDLSTYCADGLRLYEIQVSRIMLPTDWIFLCWYLPQKNPLLYESFLVRLATLEDIPAHSPIRTLFRRLQEKLTASQKMAEIEAAFAAYIGGRTRYQSQKVERKTAGATN